MPPSNIFRRKQIRHGICSCLALSFWSSQTQYPSPRPKKKKKPVPAPVFPISINGTISYQSQKPSLGFPWFPFPSVHICPSVSILSLPHLPFRSNSPSTYLLNPSSSVSLITSLVQTTIVCYIEPCHSENGLETSSIDSRLSRTHLSLQDIPETWVQFLGQEDPLETEMATHTSILVWRIHGQRSLAGCNPKGQKE